MSALATRRRARTGLEHAEQQAAARRAGALDAFAEALSESTVLDVPPPVQDEDLNPPGNRGLRPKMPAEAYELARQVYYLQHGTLRDAARAVIAAGLTGPMESVHCDEVTTVHERLQTWWGTRGWAKRATETTFAIRDANNDGGLYRAEVLCVGEATGSGPAPKGKACTQSPLSDSRYCFHHDPRPEYVEKRRVQAQRLAEGRRADMVPVRPFQRWLNTKRLELLALERERRAVHPNNLGWGLLAAAMKVDQSVLLRIMKNEGSGGRARAGKRTTTIRASTVVRYVEPIGVTFLEVYGFEAPGSTYAELVCPGCGGEKNHGSQVCRRCYDREHSGIQCAYVTRLERRCTVRTKHASVYCAKCRKIVERVPRPRPGRAGYVTPLMTILALSEYRDVPVMQWVAARMWQYDAAGVRHTFANQKSLTGSLVKLFRRHGWETAADAERAHTRLVAEHGSAPFPERPVDPGVADVSLVPLTPFIEWLKARKAEAGSYKELSARTGINADNISKWLRGVGVGAEKTTVRRFTVERAIEGWNRGRATSGGSTFADLYGAMR